MPSILSAEFEDVDDFADQISGLTVNPVQLTSGALHIDLSTLAYEDVVISCLGCNQQVSDRVYMDPNWLLVVIQLAPQRWDTYEAPPSSLTLISPDRDYRNVVFGGFRCVEMAVRVDLAEEIGLGDWLRLTVPEGIFSLPPSVTRIVEHWAMQLLQRSETEVLLGLGGAVTTLQERCVEILRWLRETVHPSVRLTRKIDARLAIQRFDLVDAALRIIEKTPIYEQPSVTELARLLGASRRTLLNAFVDVLGTSPSRYLLAWRLRFAKHSLLSGTSSTVTVAALDQGFEHFSRFSQHYRTLFGELPSQTLRRSRRVKAEKPE